MAKQNEIDKSQLSAVSRLFSASVFNELSRMGRSPAFTRLATESGLLSLFNLDDPISSVFDSAFSLLKKKNNRHEYVYKAALTHKILLGTHSLKTASMINEFRVGECKADTVILNGTGTVYEIKSERDTLSRLIKQISTYRNFFATVNVITGENHLKEVFSCVPDDVGVMLLSDRFQISTQREAQDCPERTNPEVIFSSIQIAEAKEILKLMNLATPSVPNTQMYGELRKIFKGLDPVETHVNMVKVLKKTRALSNLEELVSDLPKSLHAITFSTRIRKMDHGQLVTAVNTPIGEALTWS